MIDPLLVYIYALSQYITSHLFPILFVWKKWLNLVEVSKFGFNAFFNLVSEIAMPSNLKSNKVSTFSSSSLWRDKEAMLRWRIEKFFMSPMQDLNELMSTYLQLII